MVLRHSVINYINNYRIDSVHFRTSVLCSIGLIERVVTLIYIMNNLRMSKQTTSDYWHDSTAPNQKGLKSFCH